MNLSRSKRKEVLKQNLVGNCYKLFLLTFIGYYAIFSNNIISIITTQRMIAITTTTQ